MTLLILSISCAVMQIAQNSVADYIIGKIAANPNKYYNLSLLVSWDSMNWSVIGSMMFLFNIRIMKILTLSKRLSLFVDVLRLILKDGWNFAIFFFLIFAAFVQSFHLLLFSLVSQYLTIIGAADALLSVLLGMIYRMTNFC